MVAACHLLTIQKPERGYTNILVQYFLLAANLVYTAAGAKLINDGVSTRAAGILQFSNFGPNKANIHPLARL